MYLKKLLKNPFVFSVFIVLLIAFNFMAGVYTKANLEEQDGLSATISNVTTTESADSTSNNTATSVIDYLNIPKSEMIHSDTYSFSWVTRTYFGARTLDYLLPQLPEIFNTLLKSICHQTNI